MTLPTCCGRAIALPTLSRWRRRSRRLPGRAITDIDIAVDGDAVSLARRVADWLDGDIYVMDRERGVARVFVNWQGERFRVDFARFPRGDAWSRTCAIATSP